MTQVAVRIPTGSFKKKNLLFTVKEKEGIKGEYAKIEIEMRHGSEKIGNAEVFFDLTEQRDYASREWLSVQPKFKGKGYGSLLSDVVNDYLLGKLKIKPPILPRIINAPTTSPKAAKKLVDQGYLALGHIRDEKELRHKLPSYYVRYSPASIERFKEIVSKKEPFFFQGRRPFLLKRREFLRRQSKHG